METAAKKTWMPTVAGILDIAAGGLSLSVLFLFAIGPMIIMPLTAGTFSLNWSLFLMVIPGLAIEANSYSWWYICYTKEEVEMGTCWFNCCCYDTTSLRYSSYCIYSIIQERI